ncbi:MAG: histidinol-phosphatase [Actinomycetota bacterium]|nr:histidinol-phosphatase [Actinomycetota bacterium]
MIDLHSHILPGLDDGPETIEESRQIARAACADGITTIAATPHVRDDYPTRPEEMEEAVETLRRDFEAAAIRVEIVHGAEIAIERLPLLSREELDRFSFAQRGRYLLLECPFIGWPLALERVVSDLAAAGLTTLLAHPERNGEVKRDPALVEPLVRAGARLQLTAASLDGRFGQTTRATAERLLELRLAHVVASDAHAPSLREGGLAQAAAALADGGLARYLTEEAPAAILAGELVPEPPVPPARRRRRLRLF